MESKRLTAKVLLLGSQGVGKTSILMRQTNEGFNDKMKSTIGASFSQSTIEVEDAIVLLQIWDTAGQERFRSLVTMYYRNATAAILVYDITDNSSFLQIKSWVDELNRYVGNPVVMCVLGNKADLESHREVTAKLGREYADSIGALFFETSAQSNSGIHEAFESLAEKIAEFDAKRMEELMEADKTADNGNLTVSDGSKDTGEPKKKCNC